jgi:nucleotide-binding universal stress UspA family protein
VLTDCAALLKQAGQPEVQLMQKNGALDEILAELGDIRLMVLGRRGSRSPVGSHLESVIRLQKRPVLVVPETFRRRHGSCLRMTAVRRAGKT